MVRRPTGVRYVSFPGGHGYGDAADAYIAGLRQAGVPVTWTPMVFGSGTWGPDCPLGPLRDADVDIPYDTLLLHINPWFYRAWLDNEPGDAGVKTVGLMAWEMDGAPSAWREVLDELDLVIVPSTFNQEVVRATGTTTPVEVLPRIARAVKPTADGAFGPITDEDYVFYTIGPWCGRRAIAGTLRAFLDEFTSADRVAMIVKTSASDYQASLQRDAGGGVSASPHVGRTWWTVATILAEYPNPPKLHLVADEVPLSVIDQIHTRGDCYVGLTRGEGWGLASFDAALFGNPPIVTGWGGVLEYLGEDHPLLVDYDLVPTIADAPYGAFDLTADMRWAHADRGHASKLMRWTYEHREEAAEIGSELRRKLHARYDGAKVTSRLLDLVAR